MTCVLISCDLLSNVLAVVQSLSSFTAHALCRLRKFVEVAVFLKVLPFLFCAKFKWQSGYKSVHQCVHIEC